MPGSQLRPISVRSAVILLPEALGIITAAAESYLLRDLCDAVICLAQHLDTELQPVPDQILERGKLKHSFENPAAFSLADKSRICYVVE